MFFDADSQVSIAGNVPCAEVWTSSNDVFSREVAINYLINHTIVVRKLLNVFLVVVNIVLISFDLLFD